MGLQPKTVTIIVDEGHAVPHSSFERVIPIEQIRPGDIVLVKPGERIAVDGIVTEGSSYVDESMLSGEPVAVSKHKDAKVFAGTINQKGSFRFRAEKIGTDTLLAKIIHMVQDAQGSKAPVQQLVDKIAGDIRATIIGIAVLASSHGCYWTEPADSPTDCWHLSRWSSSPARVHWDWLLLPPSW